MGTRQAGLLPSVLECELLTSLGGLYLKMGIADGLVRTDNQILRITGRGETCVTIYVLWICSVFDIPTWHLEPNHHGKKRKDRQDDSYWTNPTNKRYARNTQACDRLVPDLNEGPSIWNGWIQIQCWK